VDSVLEDFALAESADRRTGEFSGGMLQRLGLAIGFLQEVDLLVLDEPTVNLDPPGILKLNEMQHEAKEKGTTIVFSSHLLRNAMELADRVGILVDGRMVEPEEAPAFHEAVSRRTRVRVVLSRLTEDMIAAVREAGGDVSGHNGREVSFTALPQKRLHVIRAIEQAGGAIEEFHTDAPDWDALIQEHLAGMEKRR
jgi:ABC-type multidrug transport system ATPase subunit